MNYRSLFSANQKSKIIYAVFCIIIVFGCNKRSNESSKSGIYTTQNYTDLILDESSIDSYFNTFPESDSIKQEVNLFYKNRDYQFAWFNKKGMTAAVPNFYNQIQNYSTDFKNKTFKNERLDSLVYTFGNPKIPSSSKEKSEEELEILLTTTFFKYSNKVYGGMTKSPYELDW
ncbi:hypothetical protein, partial [Flavobacterium sp.]|uniref:hypothetical protein n=1 Tax=Flavobacterium sp. TaxID=239 RepID=UPI0037B210C7